jgi:tetratricopeptide (TPR) repeat protein
MELNDGKPAKAIDALGIAARYEMGTPASSFSGTFGSLYPVYVRGLAYLASRQGSEAAAEFQKIVDHSGIPLSDPVAALAHVQLARALALAGDHGKAKAAYQDFLKLWKDADGTIPILQQAKAELAALR